MKINSPTKAINVVCSMYVLWSLFLRKDFKSESLNHIATVELALISFAHIESLSTVR
jgi:hypothetical protein